MTPGLRQSLPILVVLSAIALISCAAKKTPAPVVAPEPIKIYSWRMEPFVIDAQSGLAVELVVQAYRTLGIDVQFELFSQQKVLDKAPRERVIVLGSKELKPKGYSDPKWYESIYAGTSFVLESNQEPIALIYYGEEPNSEALKNLHLFKKGLAKMRESGTYYEILERYR